MAPDTGWFNVEREGLFKITYQAFVDWFDLLNIETEDAPFDENLGAFVVRRSGMIRYLRVRGWGNGPSAEREYHSLLFGLNGIGRGTRFLIPNLHSIKDRSLVIIDPKGELMPVTAADRRTLSEVAILNPFSMLCLGSKGFNKNYDGCPTVRDGHRGYHLDAYVSPPIKIDVGRRVRLEMSPRGFAELVGTIGREAAGQEKSRFGGAVGMIQI